MNTDSLLQLLVEISGTEEPRSDPDLAWFDTHVLDSMRVVEMIVELEERLGGAISPAEFDRECWATPARFVQDVEACLATLA